MLQKSDATKWIHDYGDMLYRFAYTRVNDMDIAKDLVQETYLAAWRNHESFKGEISEKNWLFTILKNKIIDHYRKASTRLTDRLPDAGNEDMYFNEEDHWTTEASPANWNAEPNSTVERKEFYQILNKCKSKLAEMQKAVFAMKYTDDLESEEICKALQITASNYWVLMHRAKLQLRNCLEKNWFVK